MKILQSHFAIIYRRLFVNKFRFHGALVTLVVIAALSGCSGGGHSFVESAQAETSVQQLGQSQSFVKRTQDDENFSSNNDEVTSHSNDVEAVGIQHLPLITPVDSAWADRGTLVPALDAELIAPNTSWQYAHYVNYPVTISGQHSIGHKVIFGAGLTTLSEGRLGFDRCGAISVTDDIVDELRYPPIAPESCDLKDVTARFYQADDHFSVEYYCAERLVSSRHYQQVADAKVNFYHLEFNTLDPVREYSDADACVEITHQWNDQNFEYINTKADIYGDVMGERYSLQILLKHTFSDQSFFTFDSRGDNQGHDFALNFEPFGRYSSTQQEVGFILWTREPSSLNMRAEFEVVIDDVVEGKRHVKGVIVPSI